MIVEFIFTSQQEFEQEGFTAETPQSFENIDEEEDEEDDEDDEDLQIPGVRTGLMDKKKAALMALGAMALHTKQDFIIYLEVELCCRSDRNPHYLQKTMIIYQSQLNHWDSSIREEALSNMPSLVEVVHDMYPSPKWEKGIMNKVNDKTHQVVDHVVEC